MAVNDFSAQNGTDKISDNLLSTVNGTDVSATIIKVQRVKAGFGVDGALQDVNATNPLPTQQTDGATKQGMRPDGFARAQGDPTTLLFDTFETLNTTDSWTAGGTAPTVSGGVLVILAGTTASASSYTYSKGLFTPGASAYLQQASLITLQAAVITGAKCVWGLGVFAGSPTAAVPLSNGAVFEILDTDGLLYGAVYSAGVRTLSVALTRPTDGAVHRYALYYKASRVYFEIDNVAVGSIAFPNPSVAALNAVVGTFNGATALTTAPTLTASLVGVADTGRNNIQISDGTYAWRKTQVGKNGGLSVKGAAITGTSGSIAAAGTGTIGPIAVDEAGNCTFTVKNTVAASAYAGTPILVFEQSDDNVSWGPMSVTRADTGATASTFTLAANTASAELMFDAALEGTNWIRCRVTTGPTTNALTVNITVGGMPFSPSISIIPQPITKGTQGTSGITTQALRDSGRVAVAITAYQAAGIITTEALFAAATFSSSRDGAVATTGQQFSVTAGKRFLLQSISVSVKQTGAVATTAKLALRYAAAGGVISNTSPILALMDIGSNVATAANYMGPFLMPIPDGMELIAGSSFGFTSLASAATALYTISLIGFEY